MKKYESVYIDFTGNEIANDRPPKSPGGFLASLFLPKKALPGSFFLLVNTAPDGVGDYEVRVSNTATGVLRGKPLTNYTAFIANTYVTGSLIEMRLVMTNFNSEIVTISYKVIVRPVPDL